MSVTELCQVWIQTEQLLLCYRCVLTSSSLVTMFAVNFQLRLTFLKKNKRLILKRCVMHFVLLLHSMHKQSQWQPKQAKIHHKLLPVSPRLLKDDKRVSKLKLLWKRRLRQNRNLRHQRWPLI